MTPIQRYTLAAMMVASPLAGYLVGKIGAVVPIRLGLAIMMAGLAVLIAGTARHPVFVITGLALAGFGYALCLTPITSLAMTSVPSNRAGMASGIMSAQRAIGSPLGFAVMGSVFAAWLSATLDVDLVRAVPDASERREVRAAIIAGANPRAYVAAIGPDRARLVQRFPKIRNDAWDVTAVLVRAAAPLPSDARSRRTHPEGRR